MTGFPEGHFTITNADTGRCIRAELGKTTEYRDYQLGNTYIDKATEKPKLILGDSSTVLEAAWRYSRETDPWGKLRATLISVAVDVKQNIGNYGLGISSTAARSFPGEICVREDMVPFQWTGTTAQWHEFAIDIINFLLKSPPPTGWKGTARGWAHCMFYGPLLSCQPSDIAQIFSAIPATDEDSSFFSYSREDEQEAINTLSTPPEWGDNNKVALVKYAVRYKKCARTPGVKQGGTTGMIGTGTEKGWNKMNKRWQTDGTYIWSIDGGDLNGGPVESESYLTEYNGSLVGLPKGEPKQKWIIKSL